MRQEEIKKLKQQLDMQLILTLRLMDESPIIQKITKMKPHQLESLSGKERKDIQTLVLNAIEVAKEKAIMITEKSCKVNATN